MFSSPKLPDPPNPAATAAAQQGLNTEAARLSAQLNRIDTYTPFGSAVYTQDPNNKDKWTLTQQLAPSEQQQLELERLLGRSMTGLGVSYIDRIAETTGQPLTFNGIPEQVVRVGDDFAAERQRVEDAVYGRMTGRLDPQYSQLGSDLETRLATMGITRGSQAWNREMENFERNRADAYAAARQDAITAGGAEQSRLFGLSAADAAMQNAARQQGIQERLLLRNAPINELAALLGTAPGIQLPQFAAPPAVGVSPADITGPTQLNYQGQIAAAQQRQAQLAALQGSLFGLAGAGLSGWLSN